MRDCSKWNESIIQQLPRGEFDWLEFKARKSLDFSLPSVDENKVLDELSKQVSAFANTGGGTLVYGMTDPTDLSERKVDDGGISITLKGRNTKEWLEDVIPNLVEHPLRRFNVYVLTKNSGAPNVADGRALILIEIPDSQDAPHQARDKRYYARIGGKSCPIGHRIISDIFNRRNYASFDLNFSFVSETHVPNDILQRTLPPEREVNLVVHATNVGNVFAQYVKFFLWLPVEILDPSDTEEASIEILDGVEYIQFGENNQRRDVVGYNMNYPKYGNSWFDPILPGLSRTWKFRCHPKLRPENLSSQKATWSVHADSARETFGTVKLSELVFDIQDEHEVE